MLEIRSADPSHLQRIAEVFGRAFVTEPMMTWPLGGGSDDLEERCTRAYALYLAPLLDTGLVWETTDGHGALVLVPPDRTDVWDDAVAHVDDSTTHDVTDDGGLRHERFWDWVASKIPPEPLWHLDSVAVEPGWQGRGIGSALVEFGLEQARASNNAVILETGTPRNVTLYERLGFHVVEEADPPAGGPHVWFMRRDP
ncbi:GNAT family N-acetyltransferase [Nocardioides taihuensis]|uniref:GNAT family N-acetyltransferase n=1 Tax=Nocardioides taihuensis TaxID=1835606 RepID=A0ABW0BNM9_9ACTN